MTSLPKLENQLGPLHLCVSAAWVPFNVVGPDLA